MCVTMLKSKHAQLSVAKISSVSHATEPVVGAVSLKYIVSPAPIDRTSISIAGKLDIRGPPSKVYST